MSEDAQEAFYTVEAHTELRDEDPLLRLRAHTLFGEAGARLRRRFGKIVHTSERDASTGMWHHKWQARLTLDNDR